jgi:hypothetical protein
MEIELKPQDELDQMSLEELQAYAQAQDAQLAEIKIYRREVLGVEMNRKLTAQNIQIKIGSLTEAELDQLVALRTASAVGEGHHG